MDVISRKHYADKIDAWIGKGQVIVVTGQRRVGKSYILKDFALRHATEPDANIVLIDKEQRKFRFITNDDILGQYIEDHQVEGKHNYILVDEIQDIKGWEHAIRSFRTEENTDIVITGSNSHLLSSELGTYLGGRYVEIHVQGLSYAEFLQFHTLYDSEQSLMLYLQYGSLPGLRKVGLNDDDQVWDYLRSVFNTVVLKDIVERHNIRNIPFLNSLTAYLADTCSKPQSATNISRYLKSQGIDVSVKGVLSYIDYLQEAYLVKSVNRYDIHGKKILENQQKIYFSDLGLRNLVTGGEHQHDIEKVIETIVFQHLLRLGYHVDVGELRVGEIDFVCRRTNQLKYVQVAYLISDEKTAEREFGRLAAIKDSYPKYVISASPLVSRTDHNGILHLGLREFLLNGF